MPKPTIILTHPLFPDLVNRHLKPHARVKVVRSRSELLKAIPMADGLITLLTERVDEQLLQAAPRLRAVANVAVGVDNIDLAACAERGVRVTNTPRVLTRATAEMTLALLLAAARRLPEGEAICRKNAFSGWTLDYLLGQELRGRHAVILGAGQIGREVARLFRALGISTEFIVRGDSSPQIDSRLRRAQILSIHCPLTSETHHWLNARRLALLPSDAIVLNTSRGPVIEEKALIRALQNRRIFAAGLDVFEHEPEIPKGLRLLSNVVLAPHLGSATTETRRSMAHLAIQGVLGLLRGQHPRNEVRFPRTYGASRKRPSNHHRL